jgi:hypothetical protein
MADMFSADGIDQIMAHIQGYRRLLKLIELKSSVDGVCSLPHKVMANFLDATPEDVQKWLKKLLEFGIIEKVAPDYTYKIIDSELEHSPLDYVADLLNLLKENPELSFFLQAKALGITVQELELLFGLIIQIMNN